MRRLLLLVALLVGHTASAATIEAERVDDGVIIMLSGPIVLNDDAQLGRLMQPYSKGVVVLNSEGGNLYAGLSMGRMIKDKGFNTLVERGCFSACALMWLAGHERYLGAKGIIGFHAASSIADNGVHEVSSSGNALVGAYMAKLGLSDQAIFFATQADPDDIAILTPAQAVRLGIAYKALPAIPPPPSPVVTAPVMPRVAQRIGPSYDCTKANTAAAQFICADADLSRIDLELVQPYYVLRHQVGPAGWKSLMTEAVAAMDATLLTCGIDTSGNILPVNRGMLRTCLIFAYSKQRAYWLSKLGGAGLQEATRMITLHIGLQKRLQSLGFLPATEQIDGIYGTVTRTAIINWQLSARLTPTGLLGDEDASRLGVGLTSAR